MMGLDSGGYFRNYRTVLKQIKVWLVRSTLIMLNQIYIGQHLHAVLSIPFCLAEDGKIRHGTPPKDILVSIPSHFGQFKKKGSRVPPAAAWANHLLAAYCNNHARCFSISSVTHLLEAAGASPPLFSSCSFSFPSPAVFFLFFRFSLFLCVATSNEG